MGRLNSTVGRRVVACILTQVRRRLLPSTALIVLLAGPVNSQSQTTAVQSAGSWVSTVEVVSKSVVTIETDKGLGTGFIVRADGTLITNFHVIKDANAIIVRLETGEFYRRVFVLSVDESRDLAVMRIEGANLPFLEFEDSNTVRTGQAVLLVGSPRGLEQTISEGIVSAVRTTDSGSRVIQTTAAASPGSSGGPLVNHSGRVIGILSSSRVDGQNLNFAIPSNYALGMVSALDLAASIEPERVLESDESLETVAETSTAGVVILTTRTSAHVSKSSQEVYQSIVDELLFALRSEGVRMYNDGVFQQFPTSQSASLYDSVASAGSVGAESVLHIEVDRPWNKWLKLTLRCYDLDGNLLWEEAGTAGGGLTSGGDVADLLEKMANRLRGRAGQEGLPVDPQD